MKSKTNFPSKQASKALTNAFLLFLLLLFPIFAKTGDSAKGSFMLMEYKTDEHKFLSEFLKNKNILVSFWATYCEPCKKEIPEILRLIKKYPQLKVYFINIDPGRESQKVKEMIASFGIEEFSLLDIHQVAAEVYIKPKLAVPASFIIDKKGKIVFESIGFEEDTLEKIEKAVKKLK